MRWSAVGIQAVIVFAAVVLVEGCALWRVERYYGHLLRGNDAQFYYAATRSLVVGRDLNISDDIVLTPDTTPFDFDKDGYFEEVPRDERGRILHKRPIGLSIIEAPWLWAAVAWVPDPRSETRALGYSVTDIRIVAFGLVLLIAAGLALLYALICRSTSAPWAVFAVWCAWWGTSLFCYSTAVVFMAHATAFTLVIATVFVADSLRHDARTNLKLSVVGALAGLLYLIRPQQVLLLVLLWPYFRRLSARDRRVWMQGAVTGAACLVLAIGFQAAVYAMSFGQRIFSGYYAVGEWTFDWFEPQLLTVLVDSARGLLVFSPIVVVACAGYILNWWRVPIFGWVLLAHAIVQLYVIAAWSGRLQGDSFGARMWSECAGMVAVGVSLLETSAPAIRLAWAVVATACVVWTSALLIVYIKQGFSYSTTYGDLVRAVLSLVTG